ncbi:LysR family transcriptional regulator [Aquabacterium sp. A7-Y]|uniref:LysR family transcriptional regulator n=1 Tax=Aquabacterium sp. A7-Y TaxID=1349605 RepID=UPI00223D6F67|nr:LysR family transcriptional regulator [Aquabacterium sp. A7-Y]MCW7538440.1 LysR family transcriptional regulator [Aquabacterium sp. A7-Y]
MNDRLSGIDVFVQAVEAGSFSLAAERLLLTRSAVAKTIARLEQRLGTRLFHRTTRSQSLTDDGQAFFERCVRALGELEAGEAELDSGRREPSGRLRVSAPVVFGRHCVAPLLLQLAARHPRLDIEMHFSDRVVDLVDDGYDLAVRIGPLPDSSSLAARRLGQQRMGICAAPSYLARHGRPANFDELSHHTGILYHRADGDKPWRVQHEDGQTREVRVQGRVRLDDLQAIADAAVAGVGLAWLPCWLMAPHLGSGALELVFSSRRVASVDIQAVWPQSRYLTAKTRVAIDTLVEGIPALLSARAGAQGGPSHCVKVAV